MSKARTLPVRQWYLRVEPLFDKAAALQAWRMMAKAQGWSVVGEPEIVWDGGANPGVIGKVVEYPGLTISPDVGFAVTVPS